jgi:DNA-directed RNA polymerase specialized sigma subunit
VGEAVHIDPLDWVLDKVSAAKKAVRPISAPSVVPPGRAGFEKKDLSGVRSKEVELWHDWKNSGFHPAKLDPLLKSMKGLIESNARTYKNKVEIPVDAIDFEYKQRFVDAAKKYDPSKGTLHTWITGQLMKRPGRFIKSNQNFARSPENVLQDVGKFNRAKATLAERLGHEPDAHSIAQETGFSLKQVKRLTKEIRRGLIASGDAEDIPQMSAANANARVEEVKHLIYPQLTKEEKIVHEYTTGMFGKPKLRTSEIAKKLGWDDSKVSKKKKDIWAKMQHYLGDE